MSTSEHKHPPRPLAAATTMLKTDFRAAFRSLKRYPAYAAIIVAGLSLGIAATLSQVESDL